MRRLLWPGAVVAVIVLVAVLAPLLPLHDPVVQDVGNRLARWLPDSPLGRDEFGRDVLSRLIWGARASLTVAFVASLIAAVAGTALGLLGGWFRGLPEFLAIRGADVLLCFPPILLALLVVTLMGPGTGTLIFVLAILYLPGFIRVAYAEVLSARAQDYVEAVRALGAPTGRILLRTVLPNIAGPVLVQLSLAVAAAVVLESGLSFLGLGVVPPTPSWGQMIRGARATMEQAPTLLLWPCVTLTVTILAMNLLCDALRDALDPRGAAPPRRLLDRVLPGLLPPTAPALLEVRGLTVEIATPAGVIRPVEDLSFSVAAGRTLAIVGESGSGKSMAALAVMGLLPPAARVASGSVWFEGGELLRAPEPARRRLRGGAMAMVFQDPMSSLNPVYRIGAQVTEAIAAHRTPARDEAVSLLSRVGIADPARRARAWPHELSGGMRQRVMIAMAIANRPRLLIADEPTTALDVTVQAAILDLLADLRREGGMGMVLITHSLGVVAEVGDEVAVMYAAQIVERGSVAEVFSRPRHPYTSALLAAVPDGEREAEGIPGTVPRPDSWPPGCRFAPRCTHARAICDTPPPLEVVDGREIRCLRWREIAA
ncbi:peptide/nickel transport system permease protein [Humitalea rosea]|uniref:Peptide/nickel transport system permease protein n=1 Tax=Humitalea rosea TaxID=990373 RepID=A0A2W7IEV8_9PROT|nr:dipeptide/oligopeptide/nickel ABC transporter permease/ATP-binding protein [Humitalea rosea]PZW43635.1 peptide/nickel transport system permease protein [Humitalea rosea]